MLVIVKHRDIETLLQRSLNRKALGRGDVFQIDAAECRGDICDGFDKCLGARRFDLNIKYVDTSEVFEQDRFTLHHRLGRQRSDLAQAEHGAAVGNNGDEVSLVGVSIHTLGVARDRAHGSGNAGAVCERQVVLGGAGFRGLDPKLAGFWQCMVLERSSLEVFAHGRDSAIE